MTKQQKALINLYIDGELDASDVKRVDEMIVKDHHLQRYFEDLMRLNGLLGLAYELPKNQTNVEHIVIPNVSKKTGVIKWISSISWTQPVALAASLAAVMVFNKYALNQGIDLSVIEKHITSARYDALENKLSNESLYWNLESDQLSIIVTPIKTYKTSQGIFCREYKEVISHRGEAISREGMACRKGKQDWPNKTTANDFYNQG